MDKKEKLLTISVKKAWIVGIIVTLITAALYGYLFSKYFNDVIINHEKYRANLYRWFLIIYPIMIAIIGTTIAGFISIVRERKK